MGDRRKCQTYTASPAEPGGLPVMLVRCLTLNLPIRYRHAKPSDLAVRSANPASESKASLGGGRVSNIGP